jgi:hypothetical protein
MHANEMHIEYIETKDMGTDTGTEWTGQGKFSFYIGRSKDGRRLKLHLQILVGAWRSDM